jgi:glycosyltransferase involved in cell wall biosynthesis
MKIALLEPFFGGSHQTWAEGWQRNSRHDIHIFGLPGRHWKWRMHGGAVTLARQFRESKLAPDLIVATDMLDLSVFLGLTRDLTAKVPIALYFHENQLAYPWSPTDKDPDLQRDNHYSFINFTSAIAADHLYFNSAYNRDSFLGALPDFLKRFPDHRETSQINGLKAKSEVLPLGMDLEKLKLTDADDHDPGPPLVLWNHRWEYDKNPDLFFQTLMALSDDGIDFRLAVLGESYGKSPAIFAEAKEHLADKIVHWGYTKDFETYKMLIHRADLLPVTSRQDFFGGSVVEAMYAGCRPLLPRRLAYPEHVPQAYASAVFYDSDGEFKERLRALLIDPQEDLPVKDWVEGYDWSVLAERYDAEMAQLRAETGQSFSEG